MTDFVIDPGALDRRLMLEAPMETPDGAGGVVRTYQSVATLWASVEPLAARGEVVAAQLGATVTHRILRDEKSSGTNAGTFTQATDVTRTLNTKTDPDSIVVLASNQFQLGPGTWLIQWSAPGYRCESHKSWLYNVTDAAVASYGTNENSGALDVVLTKSTGAAIVTIAVAKAFEIRHRCTTTKADNGLGLAVSLGAEVYTEVVVRSYQQA